MQEIYNELVTRIDARQSAFKWTYEKTYNF